MKTFETEKHNIPEGATHYRNECNKRHFLWVKVDGDDVTVYIDSEGEFLSANWLKGGRYIGSVKPIPQTNIETPKDKVVEWVSGDIAIYEGKQALIIAYHPNHPSVVIETTDNDYLNVLASELSKPETEAERAERERVNAIVEMASIAIGPEFDLAINDRIKDICSKIHDAGYIKGELK